MKYLAKHTDFGDNNKDSLKIKILDDYTLI